MTVYPMVNPSVSVSPVDTLVCAGSSPVFTALPTNGGDAPTYQWWVNGAAVGGNQPMYTETHPTNGNTITVTVTSNASCLITDTATSSPVLISVNIPSVRISGDSVLSLGASASFSAAADSAGVNPLYQWQDSSASHGWQNLGASGAVITYTPISSGVGLRCILTDVTGCSATSNTVIFRLTGTASGTACYPNPAYTVLNVVNAEPSDPLLALTVTDAFGNQCLTMTDFSSQNPIRVDVAPLSNGFYFVRTISTSGKIGHFSFIKL
jgi:hypothetical protein